MHSELDRSQLYLNALPLFSSGRAKLLDHERLTNQFLTLERRTQPGGRDRVDHAPGGHDDLANSAAGALVLAANTKNQPIIVSAEALRRAALTPRGTPFSQTAFGKW